MEVRTYTSESSVRNPKTYILSMARDLIKSRELAWVMARRDVSAQYRQSILGILWAFITPLATTVTWVFLNSTGIINVGKTDIPYPAYVFSGTLLWAIFTDSVNSPLQQAFGAKGLLAKINFPKEAIILSGIYKVIFNGGIKVILLLIALVTLGVFPGWTLVFFPLAFLSLVLTGTAIGLLLTPIGMLYTDIGRGLPLFFQFIMYITPVVYPMPEGGWVAKLLHLNPLTPLILSARSSLTGTDLNYLFSFGMINIFFLGILIVAWVLYRAAMPILVERMST